MSEWQAFVCCTCFRDGLAADPPGPRSALIVNAFGIVTRRDSEMPDDDPMELRQWRDSWPELNPGTEPACSHEQMRVVDEIFCWPGARSHGGSYPVVESIVSTLNLVGLHRAIYAPEGSEHPSGGVWMTSDEATACVRELDALRAASVPAEERCFVDVLTLLVQASARTGNPVITFYNGIIDGAW